MLNFMLDGHVIYVLMGMSAVLGIVAKVVVGMTLRKLVAAAESMGKSNHPLMRLVRAKFEHTCMISDKVENVSVFVDKYIYEYRTGGIKLHTWRRLEMAGAGICLVLGGAGAMLSYRLKGVTDQMAVLGGTGVALALIVFLIHLLTDEEYRLDALRNYMVDYLENICQHRYEKNYKREMQSEENPVVNTVSVEESVRDAEAVEAERVKQKIPESDSLIWAMYKTEPLQVEDERKGIGNTAEDKMQNKGNVKIAQDNKETEQVPKATEEKEQEETGRNQRIREILEEFMA